MSGGDEIDYRSLAAGLIPLAHQAGRIQLHHYRGNFRVEIKADKSPVTQADQASEQHILRGLAEVAPDIPVIAEEAFAAGLRPATGDLFFLVDPLDGTKEFISRNGEFTVNIGLIHQGEPVFGLVYAPASHDLFLTLGQGTAVRGRLDADEPDVWLEELDLEPIAARQANMESLTAMVSRSHMCEQTEEFLGQFRIVERRAAGSSLKFCLIAAGEADLYPRFTTTNEWDVAAGHAVLRAAGGDVISPCNGPVVYNKIAQKYQNGPYVAWGRR